MKPINWKNCLLMVLIAFSPSLLLADSTPNKNVPMEHDLGVDHFAAGCPIQIANPVGGDLMAAGCNIDVSGDVGGNVFAMGGNVRVEAPIKEDLYGAGGHIFIDSSVQRNMRLAGGSVNIGASSTVGGNASIAAGEVNIDGAITGYLQAAGGNVRINGPITGDAEICAGTIELGPNARINGKLRYASEREIIRNPSAQVSGGIERVASWQTSHMKQQKASGTGWFWSVGLMIIAALLFALFPEFYKELTNRVQTRFGGSILLGFVLLVCIPFAALLALITVIGIPLAFIIMAIYPALIVIGYVSAGIALGNIALQRWKAEHVAVAWWRIGAAIVGMLVISLLGRIPFIGWLIVLVALLSGIGAFIVQLRAQLRPAAK